MVYDWQDLVKENKNVREYILKEIGADPKIEDLEDLTQKQLKKVGNLWNAKFYNKDISLPKVN
ncbi:MAG TPA: hypothetical protein VEC16_05520 [Alphaproteobacteria bacterium]|nr:hypothetical protein [Alphaproteobacteria bacterium]